MPYAHGIVFSSGGQNILTMAVGSKVRVTGGTGAYAFLQQQSTDGGGSSILLELLYTVRTQPIMYSILKELYPMCIDV